MWICFLLRLNISLESYDRNNFSQQLNYCYDDFQIGLEFFQQTYPVKIYGFYQIGNNYFDFDGKVKNI